MSYCSRCGDFHELTTAGCMTAKRDYPAGASGRVTYLEASLAQAQQDAHTAREEAAEAKRERDEATATLDTLRYDKALTDSGCRYMKEQLATAEGIAAQRFAILDQMRTWAAENLEPYFERKLLAHLDALTPKTV